MMKKIIVFLMAFTMCVGFTSCGESSTDKSNKEVTTEESTVKDVDLSAFCDNIRKKYEAGFTTIDFDSIFIGNESAFVYVALNDDAFSNLSLNEGSLYAEMLSEIIDFNKENLEVLDLVDDGVDTPIGKAYGVTKRN